MYKKELSLLLLSIIIISLFPYISIAQNISKKNKRIYAVKKNYADFDSTIDDSKITFYIFQALILKKTQYSLILTIWVIVFFQM